ncbi:MAG: hypothetical protein J6X98_00720 [Bacteroidales bacterium]|nr:hypothetical protein [Bacteroidales bacterium]
MKKNIFVIAFAAFALCMVSCQKEEITPNENGGNNANKPRVTVTSDLIGTDWTANLSLGDLIYAMTGMSLSDYGCQFPYGFDTTMVYHISFDNEYAHITFSDNISMINVAEVAGGYTNEEIENMDLAYVYNGATHTGTLTAVGTDEDGNPINYQITFTYDDDDDTITINFQFANAEDDDTTINFPLVFHRDAVNA